MRNIIIIAVAVGLLLLVGFALYSTQRTQNYQKAVKDIQIQEVDLSKIEDGEYIGECDVDYISAKVKVTVTDHTIKNIEYIYHKNDRGEKANKITQDMVEEQKIKVDAITGATNSSKVIQKAVEEALSKK